MDRKRPRKRLDRGPELLGEVLSRLFTARGWGRRQGRIQLEQAWREVAGEEWAAQTRLEGLRRKVLEVTVGSSILLQELSHFHKRRLLKDLRQKLPNETIMDIRFRAGVIEDNKGTSGEAT